MKILNREMYDRALEAGFIFILNDDGTLEATLPEHHFPTEKKKK